MDQFHTSFFFLFLFLCFFFSSFCFVINAFRCVFSSRRPLPILLLLLIIIIHVNTTLKENTTQTSFHLFSISSRRFFPLSCFCKSKNDSNHNHTKALFCSYSNNKVSS